MTVRRQQGAVLIVSLLMLVVLTLLAVSAINTSTVNLRIVDNMRAQQEVESTTQRAIEQVLSDVDNFSSPAAQTLTIDGHNVAISQPQCVRFRPATGYSAKWGLAPEDTTWEVDASLTDASTGAQANIRQGIEIRMTAGNCP